MPAVFTGLNSPLKKFATGLVDGARFSIGVTGSSGNIFTKAIPGDPCRFWSMYEAGTRADGAGVGVCASRWEGGLWVGEAE